MDVKSLYTCIPHDDGLKAVQHFLNQRNNQHPPTETIVRLTELVLTMNNFTFNGKHYIQRRGVSMGQKVGPAYACLFMGYLEQQFLSAYQGPKPTQMFRYIDDFVGIASCPENDIKNFIAAFNDFHPAIKLTHSISEVSLPFLDINLSITGSRLTTSVYYKTTDSHSYLSYNSSHPPNCINSIPYSQFLRLRRLCSDDTDFSTKAEEMMSFFIQRGYPSHILDAALTRASNTSNQPSKDANANRIPLVITYHPTNSKIVRILMKNYKLLQECPDTMEIFKELPIVAYRRDKNLSDILVHSADPAQPTQPGTTTCSRRICLTCADGYASLAHISAMLPVCVLLKVNSISSNLSTAPQGTSYMQ